ncbi:hypothetical protein B0H11DRAFT_2216188 [Mycena galericulata]|nr:hypothetical protein B0H11DRAFT_2216188 [Mycena galericulata]
MPSPVSFTPSLIPARSYAKPISPTYATKLLNGDFSVNITDRAQADSYRQMATRTLKAYWFTKDDCPPETFIVPLPNFPYFHPKDDVAITTVVGEQNCRTYSVLDGVDWVTTSTAQTVKPGSTICFRSLGVTVCTGGPLNRADPPLTPVKRKLSTSNGTDDGSPTKITRLSTPSQIRPSEIISIESDDDSQTDDPVVSSPSKPSQTIAKKSRPWPLKYTCDMDKGFQEMAVATGKREIVFERTFVGCKWVHSTFYENLAVWKAAKKAGALEDAVKQGSTKAGAWHRIYKKYSK